MTPFNLTLARAGHPVVTRDGRKATILKFDLKSEQPLVAVVQNPDGTEESDEFSVDGRFYTDTGSSRDLFMAPLPENPWSKPEDVPGPVCWVRAHQQNAARLILAIEVGYIYVASLSHEFQGTKFGWNQLVEFEYSTDRITWKPCTTPRP